jgi:hypothetical protein
MTEPGTISSGVVVREPWGSQDPLHITTKGREMKSAAVPRQNVIGAK